MCTVTLIAEIDGLGHLKLDVPTDLPAGKAQVTVTVEPQSKPRKKYDFRDLIGKLQWKGDALAEQRRLRDEWPD